MVSQDLFVIWSQLEAVGSSTEKVCLPVLFTFSLQPGSGGKPFPDILCDCCCSWAQHNIGNLPSNVEQTPSSIV